MPQTFSPSAEKRRGKEVIPVKSPPRESPRERELQSRLALADQERENALMALQDTALQAKKEREEREKLLKQAQEQSLRAERARAAEIKEAQDLATARKVQMEVAATEASLAKQRAEEEIRLAKERAAADVAKAREQAEASERRRLAEKESAKKALEDAKIKFADAVAARPLEQRAPVIRSRKGGAKPAPQTAVKNPTVTPNKSQQGPPKVQGSTSKA